jgi:hypothetical protein
VIERVDAGVTDAAGLSVSGCEGASLVVDEDGVRVVLEAPTAPTGCGCASDAPRPGGLLNFLGRR